MMLDDPFDMTPGKIPLSKPAKDNGNDCYSAGERGFMTWWNRVRERSLAPMLKAMDDAGITPNHITLAALVIGLIAAGTFIVSKPVALVLLTLHVMLDGLDGPLARYQGTASPKGSFTDTMSDQIVITAVMLVMAYMGYVSIVAGGVFVFVYTLVVGFAMVRNRLGIPYSWLVRPRFAFYVWMEVEFWLWPGTLDYVIWGFNALLLMRAISGFIHIRRRL